MSAACCDSGPRSGGGGSERQSVDQFSLNSARVLGSSTRVWTVENISFTYVIVVLQREDSILSQRGFLNALQFKTSHTENIFKNNKQQCLSLSSTKKLIMIINYD